jgi:hypothetical protein
MRTEFYVEALLADQVWDKGEINDQTAILTWLRVATRV